MPKLARLSLTPPGSTIAVMTGHIDPPAEVAIPGTMQPTDTPHMDWLQALLHRGWEFVWRELPAKAVALGAFLLEQAQAVLQHQAVEYCAELTDWATQSIASWFIDPQDQTFSPGKSLMHAAAAAMPSSHEVCGAALTQLQTQAKALLAGYADDTNQSHPAQTVTSENANSTLITSALVELADFADTAISAPCATSAPEYAATLVDPDPGWQPHGHDMPSVECLRPGACASVCLVGDWDSSSFTPLI